MTELSLNILDIAQNSIRAGATLIEISIHADFTANLLTIIIKDNGCGMTGEQLQHIEDPFYTTRTTRKVGLGIPFYKFAAMSSGGDFNTQSTPSIGTTVTATFKLDHIDRMPLGDISSTMHTLIVMNSHLDFLFTYIVDQKSFTLDTKEFRSILGNIPLDTPEISLYIKEYLEENKREVDNGQIF